MAGHSKWNNIKRKKGKTDAQRAKVFTKVGRELTVAVRESGADPSANGKLRDCIAKAKANNVPNDNIERIIKKASGESGAVAFEQMIYEGYGPGGVAFIVECLTDNKNRTAADLRHYFDKNGGNLGLPGSVMYMFTRRGLILIEAKVANEEKMMEDVLSAGAEDLVLNDGVYEIITEPNDIGKVREALELCGYKFLSCELEYSPSTYTSLSNENLVKMEKLLDMLMDNDDVQDSWHNCDNLPEQDE